MRQPDVQVFGVPQPLRQPAEWGGGATGTRIPSGAGDDDGSRRATLKIRACECRLWPLGRPSPSTPASPCPPSRPRRTVEDAFGHALRVDPGIAHSSFRSNDRVRSQGFGWPR
jgi:hypothetical protein